MMVRRLSRVVLTAAAAAAALALAACGAQPYPEPAEAPPPPPPPADLAGGPTPLPPPPPQPAPAQAYAPSGPVIIAMAPIPNPPERSRRAVRRSAPRHYARAPAQRYIARPAAPRAAAPRAAAHAPAVHAPAVRAPAARPAPPKLAARPAAPVNPKVAANAKPPAPGKLGPAPALKTPAPAAGAASAGNAQGAASPLGDRATRLAALEMSLTEAMKSAKLTVPGSFTANQPADVTLTIPAEFGDTLKDEAAKQELSDAAAAVNLTAVLSGDGFSVTPDATQSQPLVAGQATEFHWTVTAQPNAKDLHADVGADLIGAGSDRLNLGTVTSGGAFKLTPRVLGAGILVLIAAIVVAWLARGRSGPRRSAAARRDARRARTEPRPVVLGENEL